MVYNNSVNDLNEKLKHLPSNPGVYVMLDGDGQIIYVGKAKNLKNRVRQYFFNGVKTDKVIAMVNNVADFYYIITPTEIDALSLENNLIKKHKPRYNILLKDDKTYPYLKIDLSEDFPTFRVVRKIKKDKCKYFGPFMGGVSAKSLLEILNLAFFIRPCEKKLNIRTTSAPCLNYHLKKCLAPCAKMITREKYLELVDEAIAFLGGETLKTENLLKDKMNSAIQKEDFELAIKYRDCLFALDRIKQKRITALNKFINADVLAYKTNGIYSAVSVLFVRNGLMLGCKSFAFENASFIESEAIFEFITRFYKEGKEIPDEIISSIEIADTKLLEGYFQQEFSKKVNFLCVKQGVRKQLCDMAEANASEYLETQIDKIKHKEDMTVVACKHLKDKLKLANYPKRMECYDVSNVSGVDNVGSMVVFIDGAPDRDSYRRFKIQTVVGANDYKCHQEMMRRRLTKLTTDPEKFPKPDLIIIDGGKGQLSKVKEVIDELGVKGIDLIALAEREEEIFLPFESAPVVLDKSDYALKMLVRIRDEAHRFAITYHKTLRGKRALSSVLDGVHGLGKVKKGALLDKFKDLSNIISATESQLREVKGIGEVQAKAIIDLLIKEGLRKN